MGTVEKYVRNSYFRGCISPFWVVFLSSCIFYAFLIKVICLTRSLFWTQYPQSRYHVYQGKDPKTNKNEEYLSFVALTSPRCVKMWVRLECSTMACCNTDNYGQDRSMLCSSAIGRTDTAVRFSFHRSLITLPLGCVGWFCHYLIGRWWDRTLIVAVIGSFSLVSGAQEVCFNWVALYCYASAWNIELLLFHCQLMKILMLCSHVDI